MQTAALSRHPSYHVTPVACRVVPRGCVSQDPVQHSLLLSPIPPHPPPTPPHTPPAPPHHLALFLLQDRTMRMCFRESTTSWTRRLRLGCASPWCRSAFGRTMTGCRSTSSGEREGRKSKMEGSGASMLGSTGRGQKSCALLGICTGGCDAAGLVEQVVSGGWAFMEDCSCPAGFARPAV